MIRKYCLCSYTFILNLLNKVYTSFIIYCIYFIIYLLYLLYLLYLFIYLFIFSSSIPAAVICRTVNASRPQPVRGGGIFHSILNLQYFTKNSSCSQKCLFCNFSIAISIFSCCIIFPSLVVVDPRAPTIMGIMSIFFMRHNLLISIFSR